MNRTPLRVGILLTVVGAAIVGGALWITASHDWNLLAVTGSRNHLVGVVLFCGLLLGGVLGLIGVGALVSRLRGK